LFITGNFIKMKQETKSVIILALGFLLGFVFGFRLEPRKLISPLAENNIQLNKYESIEEQSTSSPKLSKTYTIGKASFYNRGICELHHRTYGFDCLTANGEVFDDTQLTSACPRELLNEELVVTHEETSITVRCNDTGAFTERYDRVLDLSEGAFRKLAPTSRGVIMIKYEVIGQE